LVDEKSGMAVAERLLPVYESAGGYPVFFVWESGLLEVISNNLGEISKEKIFQLLLKKVAQFAMGKLTQSSGAKGTGTLELPTESTVRSELQKLEKGDQPFASLDDMSLPDDDILHPIEERQFQEQLEMDPDINREASMIANAFLSADEIDAERESTRGTRVHGSSHTLMSPDVLNEIRPQMEITDDHSKGLISAGFIIKHAISVLKRVIVRYAKHRSHGFHATIVEEILREFYMANIGELIWGQMKKDTEDSFQDNPQIYGGTAFLTGIKQYFEQNGNLRIVLIGHSAGAVYICHLLDHANRLLPETVKFDVVFLAPACNFNLFSEILASSAQRLNDIRFFTMKDDLEKSDQIVPVVYPHSLLYFISGILESEADMPILGMQRYYLSNPPYDSPDFSKLQDVLKYLDLENHPERSVWSIATEVDGQKSQATSHTAFDEDNETLESLKHIIKYGL